MGIVDPLDPIGAPSFGGAPDDVIKTNEPFRESMGQASEATGTTSGPTKTGTAFVTIPEMSVILTLAGGNVFVSFAGTFDVTANAPGNGRIRIMRDAATQVGPQITELFTANNDNHFLSMTVLDISPPIGEHTYTAEWSVTGGATLRAITIERQIQVQELA